MKAWSSWELVAARLRELSPADFFNARAFGFAAARAWVYLLFLGAGTSMVTWSGEPLPPAAFIASTVFLCIMLFGSALKSPLFYRAMERPWFSLVGPTLTAAGTLCLASSTLESDASCALLVVGTITTGVGSGLIDLQYGELYRDVDPKKSCFEIPFSFLIASVVYLVASLTPQVVSCLLATALPVFSGFVLASETFRAQHAAPAEDAGATSPAEPTVPSLDLGRYAWKIGACACLVGLADGVVRAVFLLSSSGSVADFYVVPLPVSNLLTLLAIYGCVLFTRKSDLRFVYRSVMLIMAVFFMLLPVFTGYSDIEGSLALTGYGTFNALIWILIAGIAHRYRFSGIVVFGIGWGMVSLGTLLGQSAGQALCRLAAPFSPQALSLIALLATVCILVSYMFVFNEDDMARLAKDPEQPEARRQRFQERCHQVADRFGLTPKETEIMILYAKGRTSRHIQDELFISRGTVTTHLRHIYQKMDVHDKQEMIDKIETWQNGTDA